MELGARRLWPARRRRGRPDEEGSASSGTDAESTEIPARAEVVLSGSDLRQHGQVKDGDDRPQGHGADEEKTTRVVDESP